MSYQALRLDGNGWAEIADASQAGLDMGLSDFMIEGWMKTSYSASDQWLVYKITANAGYNWRILASGYLRADIGDGSAVQTIASNHAVNDGRGHYCVFVVDRSSATGLKLFVDGSECSYSSQEDPTGVGSVDNATAFYITATANRLVGQLDEARIWNFGVDGLPTDYAAYITWRAQGRNVFLATSEYDSDSWASYVTNNLSAYYKFNGDYTDETTNSNDLTAGGTGNAFPGYTLKKHKIISPYLVW